MKHKLRKISRKSVKNAEKNKNEEVGKNQEYTRLNE